MTVRQKAHRESKAPKGWFVQGDAEAKAAIIPFLEKHAARLPRAKAALDFLNDPKAKDLTEIASCASFELESYPTAEALIAELIAVGETARKALAKMVP